MKSLFCCLAFFVSIASISGETIFDALSRVPTEFKFTLNDGPLDVGAQGISLRAVKETLTITDSEDVVSRQEIAYQAYHLEFVYSLKFVDKRQYAVVEFYDGNDVLHEIDLQKEGRRLSTNNGRRYEANFMAINLEGIPLIMLDHVDRINFRKAK